MGKGQNMKKHFVTILACGAIMALMLGVLAACGGSSGSSSASSASASSASSAGETVQGKGYTAVLPAGFKTEKDNYYTNGENGSFYVVIGTKSAQELLETETADGDYKQGTDVVAGDLTFMVAESEKWPDKTYYIAEWNGDDCIEVTVSRIDDPEVIKAFLSSIKPE